MIETSDFKRGVCLVYKGAPMMIEDVSFSTPTARGSNTIAKTKLRNLITGQLLSESVRSGEKFAEVDLERHSAGYMYTDGTRWYFMDNESFEQFHLSEEVIGNGMLYLTEGDSVDVVFVEHAPLTIQLPTSVVLEVAEAEDAVKGDTVSNIQKNATLSTGLVLKVPPHVKVGDKIKVNPDTGEFLGRSSD